MKSALQKEHIVALALALLLSVCGVQTLSEQIRPVRAQGDSPSTSASSFSLSVRDASQAASSEILSPRLAPTLGLAMADFTGDTHPDLASVALDRVDSANAHYWIEIRLTEGGGQILRLTAPFGGLLITPKDVTGDGNLDLVIRAAGSRALVAVFLNDGNGHFARASTESFAKALPAEPFHFSLTRKFIYLGATLGFPESHPVDSPKGSFRPLLEKKALLLPARCDAASRRFLSFSSNRAPPSLT